jgi:hypothetical protein
MIVGADGKQITSKENIKNLPRVLVGIPCGMTDHVHFEDSKHDALMGSGELFLSEVVRAVGYITADGRNKIVQTALEKGFDYVFFMDSDMVFPRGTLARMLQKTAEIPENEIPVLSGVYNTRSDHRINVYNWIEDLGTFAAISGKSDPEFKLNSKKLYKADCAGTGCMLIDCAVFEELKYPWFDYPYWPKEILKADRENFINQCKLDLLYRIKDAQNGLYSFRDYFVEDIRDFRQTMEEIDPLFDDFKSDKLIEWIEYFEKKIKPVKVEWWSEDVYFCKKLMDKGIHVYIDTEVICKHIINAVVCQVSDSEYELETITGVKY